MIYLGTQFLQKYKMLSREARAELALTFHNEPMTWNVVWIEVLAETKLASLLTKQLRVEGKL